MNAEIRKPVPSVEREYVFNAGSHLPAKGSRQNSVRRHVETLRVKDLSRLNWQQNEGGSPGRSISGIVASMEAQNSASGGRRFLNGMDTHVSNAGKLVGVSTPIIFSRMVHTRSYALTSPMAARCVFRAIALLLHSGGADTGSSVAADKIAAKRLAQETLFGIGG